MADAPANQATAAIKPPFRRPLFAKPAWAQEDKSSNATDFFRRSDQSYAHIAAQAERQRQRRQARKQQVRAQEDVHPEPAKKHLRSSTNSDSEDGSNRSSSDDLTGSIRKQTQDDLSAMESKMEEKKRFSSSPKSKSSPKSLGQRYEAELAPKKGIAGQKPLPSNIVDLEDEDHPSETNGDELVEVIAVKRFEPPPEDDGFSPSDDEFAELARKAREKARRKRLEADISSPTPDPPPLRTHGNDISRIRPVHEPTPPPTAPDAVVSILITSRIIDTKPLIVNRRVSQPLKDVRVKWCQRQKFTPDTIATVFLTWRGKRLFDVTTCKSLGIGVDSNGNIVMKGQKDILGEEERQIHMEAMTEAILEEYQKMKRGEVEGENNQGSGAHEEVAPAAETKEPQVRIILKAKGYTDFKLIVKPVSRHPSYEPRKRSC